MKDSTDVTESSRPEGESDCGAKQLGDGSLVGVSSGLEDRAISSSISKFLLVVNNA